MIPHGGVNKGENFRCMRKIFRYLWLFSLFIKGSCHFSFVPSPSANKITKVKSFPSFCQCKMYKNEYNYLSISFLNPLLSDRWNKNSCTRINSKTFIRFMTLQENEKGEDTSGIVNATTLSEVKKAETKSSYVSFDDLKRSFQKYQIKVNQNIKGIDEVTLLASYKDLEIETSQEEFWNDTKKAREVTKNMNFIKSMLDRISKWKTSVSDVEVLFEMINSETFNGNEERSKNNENNLQELQLLHEELQEILHWLSTDLNAYETERLLNGPYDQCDVRLSITSGAGGVDAEDWAAMLLRMYKRYTERKGYLCKVIELSEGEQGGVKTATLEISNSDNSPSSLSSLFIYGNLKGEKGTHRLVRISPFNAQGKRQTSFAGVDILPILSETMMDDIQLDESKDLQIDTFRSGGAGGQNVNKVETAVRITHLSTGLVVKCSEERSQLMNKKKALERLKAALLANKVEQQVNQIKEIRGDVIQANFGTQVRNYVLHPYKMVKDLRSSFETTDTSTVLDGNLDDIIADYLRYANEKGQRLKD